MAGARVEIRDLRKSFVHGGRLIEVLKNRADEVITVTILPGNQLMVHWSEIAALQIFTAGK